MSTLPPEDVGGPESGDPSTPGSPGFETPPYQTPQGGYAPPQYQAPPQGNSAPPPYQPPSQYGYAPPPTTDPVSTVTLNYWLSVFFTWIPALIFYLIEKDKGNAHARAYHAENLNFALVRIAAVFAASIFSLFLAFVPYAGLFFTGLLVPLAYIVPLVFHIMAAAKTPEAFRRGEKPPFLFNVSLIK